MYGVNIFQGVNLFNGNTITSGFDVKFYGGSAFRDPVNEIFADHVKLHEAAGYLLAQQQFSRLMLEAGLRLENHKLYGIEWAPQAGVSYKAAEQTHLKFSFSKGFRTPNMRELYMYAPANETLLPERSFSYDLTGSQRLFDSRMYTELTLFYISGDNLIEIVQIGEGRVQNRNVGRFANKGIEMNLNYHILSNLSMNVNGSFLDMEKPVIGAPRQKYFAGLAYWPGKFTLHVGAQIIHKLYLVTGETPQTSDYTFMDAKIAFRPFKWIDVFVKGDNLLGMKYETMAGYPMPRATFMGGVSITCPPRKF